MVLLCYLFINIVVVLKISFLSWQHVHMNMLHSLSRFLAVLHGNGEGVAGVHLLQDGRYAVHTQEQVRHLIVR